MRILADVRCLQDPRFAARGVGSHAAFLLETIRARAGDAAEVVGLVDERLPALAGEHADLCEAVRSVFVPDDVVTPAVFIQLSPMTHDTLPPARLLDRDNVLPTTVVYDFIPREQPERYLADRRSLFSYAAAVKWLGAYRGFFPISEHAATQLRELRGVDPDSIAVTGVATRGAFGNVRSGQEKSPLPPGVSARGHLLFVGGADPRKNLETVVAAYGRLSAMRSDVPQLVVVGGYPGEWRERVLSRLPARVRGRTDVLFLDHLADAELAALYAHSSVTVAASLAEGFSMPVVEAMASGAPVLASDIPAHRELVTDPAARFQPLAADELATRIAGLLDSSSSRLALVESQRPVAERFTATAVADRFWESLTAWQARFRDRTAARPSPRRPALAFVTPFPPDKSGVADYSLKCVEALARHVDVDVYTDQRCPSPCPGVRAFHPISAAAWLRPDYAATVAVIGNSHFHTRIIDLHERLGGACILHDNRMLELYRWWQGAEAARRMAERSLDRPVSAAEIDGWLAAPDTLPTLFFDPILARAHPAIVHSRALAGHVARLHGARVETLPFCVYRELPADLLTDEHRLQARRRLGISAETILIITLGMVTQAKKPKALVDAVNILRQWGLDAHLRFVGDAGSWEAELRERSADSAGISFSAGWTTEEEYRDCLQAADYAIQLRTHRFGGLSGAVGDCIAAGLPTVVNDDLASAFDSPSYVLRVSDELDPREIANTLDAAIGHGLHRCRHEEERRSYVESHSFDRYAVQLLDVLGVSGPRKPLQNAPRPTVDYVQRPPRVDDAPAWDSSRETDPDVRRFIERVVRPVAVARVVPEYRPLIHYWVNSTPGYPANTGIQRVVRQLGRALQERGVDLVPVRWDESRQTLVRPSDDDLAKLERWSGPRVADWRPSRPPGPGDWILFPEVPVELDSQTWGRVFAQVRRAGTRVAAVFYDAIPIKMAGLYRNADTRGFAGWIRQLADADLVLPISRHVAHDLAWLLSRETGLPALADGLVRPVPLPGAFPACPRVVRRPPAREGITVLSVGTIEPRKNQGRLVDAFARAARRCPRLERLVMVGSCRSFDRPYVDRVLAAIARRGNVIFHEELGDAELHAWYERADFTIFPSVEEGYGLPILESIWHGRPCICGNTGVMAELATGGGCLAVDVRKTDSLAAAIERLATDGDFRGRLTDEALARPIADWGDYVGTILGLLADHSRPIEAAA
jgi:glycosyltransferase involved in cell wall biosynthesis